MSIFALIWIAVVSVFCALGARNALQLYRHPRDLRSGVMSLNAEQVRRAAIATLAGLPIVWLLIVFSSLGLLGPSPFQGAN